MKTNNLADYELVNQYIQGDYTSLEQLINRHRTRIFTYIYLLVKDQHLAEDLFQDTFIRVIKSLSDGKYKDHGRFISWVIRIAHNLVIDHFRKKNQMKTLSNDNYDADILNLKKLSAPTVEDGLIKVQISKDIRNLVDELPADQKEIIILRHYVGMSFKEIAEYTNVSINTALGRMRYALINLRKLIKEKDVCLSLQ